MKITYLLLPLAIVFLVACAQPLAAVDASELKNVGMTPTQDDVDPERAEAIAEYKRHTYALASAAPFAMKGARAYAYAYAVAYAYAKRLQDLNRKLWDEMVARYYRDKAADEAAREKALTEIEAIAAEYAKSHPN